jgi:hypothetical protein
MEWGAFRALETFALLYDIQTDEEEYNSGPCYFLCKDRSRLTQNSQEDLLLDTWESDDCTCQPWQRKVVAPKYLEAVCEHIGGIALDDLKASERVRDWNPTDHKFTSDSLPRWDEIGRSWQYLLAAKLVRGTLMAMCCTAGDRALDLLAEELGRMLPRLPNSLVDPLHSAQARREIEQAFSDERRCHVPDALAQLLLRVLYLLEMSACYHDSHSIAHAHDALGLLTRSLVDLGLDKREVEGQSPYELVGLYSRALGQMHTGEHGQAAESFSDVATYSSVSTGESRRNSSTQTLYFEPPSGSEPQWLRFFRWPSSNALFRCYVGHPAALLAAEALNKQQRSHEALQWLVAQDDEQLSKYRQHRKRLLGFKFRNDTGENPTPPDLPADLEYAQRLAQSTEACLTQKTPWLQGRSDLLVSRAKRARQDRTEFDQVLLEWAGGVDDIGRCFKRAEGYGDSRSTGPNEKVEMAAAADQYLRLSFPGDARDGDRSFFDAAVDLVEDTGYRDHRPETRKNVFDGVWHTYWWADGYLRSRGKASTSEVVRLRDTAKSHLVILGAALMKASGSSDFNSVPLYLGHIARSRSHLASGRPLPLAGSTARVEELRRFIVSCLPYRSLSGGNLVRMDWLAKWRCAKLLRACRKCDRFPPCGEDGGKCPLGLDLLDRSALCERQGGPRSEIEHYWDGIVRKNWDGLVRRLKATDPPRTDSGWGLAILQRWNSFTPAMAATEGGGYFLFRGQPAKGCSIEEEPSFSMPPDQGDHFGLAVDPGYGFVKNMLAEGYGIHQVTAVAVTHDHPDHLADFDALHNLLFELRKRPGLECTRGVDVLLTAGVLDHLSHTMDSSPREVIRDTVVLSDGTHMGVSTYDFQTATSTCLEVVGALHSDLSGSHPDGGDSIGLIIAFDSAGGRTRIGIPSDTAWCADLAVVYRDCDVVCLHLGSISDRDRKFLDLLNRRELDEVLQGAKHLYLPGVLWFTKAMCDKSSSSKREGDAGQATKLVVLSEFGEELSRGIRVELARALDRWFSGYGAVKVVPGDVGLLVDPVQRSLRCSCCECFYSWDSEFEYELFGDSEQVFYVCPGCHRALSYNQRANIYRRKQIPLLQRFLTRQ